MEPNIRDTWKTREGPSTVTHRVRRIAKMFDGDTQRTRGQLILDLKALQELCSNRAIDANPKQWKQQQNWARLAAYISQVINSICRVYDTNKIKEILQQLEEKVSKLEQARKQDKKSGEKGRKSRKNR